MADLPSDDQITEFKDKGVTVLRGVFADWVEVLRAGVDANMADPDPNARIYKGENGGGRFFVDYCNWSRIPEYKDFILEISDGNPPSFFISCWSRVYSAVIGTGWEVFAVS